MRYRIKHITEYKYASRVTYCYNLAHIIPRKTDRQDCLSNQIDASPVAVSAAKRDDYFGNTAYHFEIQRPHQELSITAVSEVETRNQQIPSLDVGVSCAEVTRQMLNPQNEETLLASEYQMDSSMVKATPELKAYAEDLFQDDVPFLSAVSALTKRIYDEFEYSPQATTIATPIEEVMANKKGVCQDFAHLQIGCLRALGFAAKYVSGYLETIPPEGQEKLVGADATHAWIAVYSPGEGWFEFDPTNNTLANEQHIVTALGRDFYDVTPLKGVIFGGGLDPIMSVSVDVARVEAVIT